MILDIFLLEAEKRVFQRPLYGHTEHTLFLHAKMKKANGRRRNSRRKTIRNSAVSQEGRKKDDFHAENRLKYK